MKKQKKKKNELKIKKDELIAAGIIIALYGVAVIVSHTPLINNSIIAFFVGLFLKNTVNVLIIIALLVIMYCLKVKVTTNKMKALFEEDIDNENS